VDFARDIYTAVDFAAVTHDHHRSRRLMSSITSPSAALMTARASAMGSKLRLDIASATPCRSNSSTAAPGGSFQVSFDFSESKGTPLEAGAPCSGVNKN
jgi:hypothetical protein